MRIPTMMLVLGAAMAGGCTKEMTTAGGGGGDPRLVEGAAANARAVRYSDPTREVRPEALGVSLRAAPPDAQLVTEVRNEKGRVFVRLKPKGSLRSAETGVLPGLTAAERAEATDSVLASIDYSNLREFQRWGLLAMTTRPEDAPRIARLPWVDNVTAIGAASPGIEGASTTASAVEATTSSETVDWGLVRIGAPTAWDVHGVEGHGTTVAIIDYGPDSTHYGGELPVGLRCLRYYLYLSCLENGAPHGAYTAGTAFARRNLFGTVGVAPSPTNRIYFKACDDGECEWEMVQEAIEWLIDSAPPRTVAIFALQDSTIHPDIAQAFQDLYDSGVLAVAAAGNESHLPWLDGTLFPARLPSVISVSGMILHYSDSSEVLASGSRRAETSADFTYKSPELAAPYTNYTTGASGAFAYAQGTSISAPMAGGVAALVWSRNPTWTNAQVRSWLRATAAPRPGVTKGTYDFAFGYGRVDAATATMSLDFQVSIDGPTETQPSAVCTWAASVQGIDPALLEFSWSQNGLQVGTAQELTTARQVSSTPYTLQLFARAGGVLKSASISVSESSMAMECLQ